MAETKTKGVYFKCEDDLKRHVDTYVFNQQMTGKLKDGLSGLIRKLLIRETKYAKN